MDLGGSNLVVAVGDDHVLKLAPLAFERELRGEESALPLVDELGRVLFPP